MCWALDARRRLLFEACTRDSSGAQNAQRVSLCILNVCSASCEVEAHIWLKRMKENQDTTSRTSRFAQTIDVKHCTEHVVFHYYYYNLLLSWIHIYRNKCPLHISPFCSNYNFYLLMDLAIFLNSFPLSSNLWYSWKWLANTVVELCTLHTVPEEQQHQPENMAGKCTRELASNTERDHSNSFHSNSDSDTDAAADANADA